MLIITQPQTVIMDESCAIHACTCKKMSSRQASAAETANMR